jgi:hypothetical protein
MALGRLVVWRLPDEAHLGRCASAVRAPAPDAAELPRFLMERGTAELTEAIGTAAP